MKLYIVDDDPIYMMLIKKAIANVNATVEISEFADGLLALNRLVELSQNKEELPDIILLDLSMPIMDGWEFLNEYVQLPSRLRNGVTLYIVSSSISPMDVERSMQYDVVTDFLIKPLDRERIAGIIL